MNILIDENMSFAAQLFSPLGTVIAKSGRSLNADDLVDIDALMIRSVTNIDEALLQKANRLKFIGSATAGIDHVDVDLLATRGIYFTGAPGCNKVGVAEYVISALLVLSQQQGFTLCQRKVGIVGAGQVGSYLSQCLSALNIPYLLCDPLKEQQGDRRTFHGLDTLLAECDVITVHTPLTRTGKHATFHLFGERELNLLKPNTILINAARGGVVDNQALKNVLSQKSLFAVLDVFESEPEVDLALLALLSFATPHIAGYGLEGKARGTTMIYNAYCTFLANKREPIDAASLLPVAEISRVELAQPWDQNTLMSLCQLIYDIRRDDADFRRAMKESTTQRASFDQLRKNYWDRREYSAIRVAGKAMCGVESLAKVGFTVEEYT